MKVPPIGSDFDYAMIDVASSPVLIVRRREVVSVKVLAVKLIAFISKSVRK